MRELEARAFWRLLEDATWVLWDRQRRYCFVWLPGEGGRVFRYQGARAVQVAEGEEAVRLGRAVGVEDAAA